MRTQRKHNGRDRCAMGVRMPTGMRRHSRFSGLVWPVVVPANVIVRCSVFPVAIISNRSLQLALNSVAHRALMRLAD